MNITTEETKKQVSQLLQSGMALIHSKIIVVVAVPAAGKKWLNDAFVTVCADRNISLAKIVTATNRPKRKNEVNGEDYHFFSNKQFEKIQLLENTTYTLDGFLYGIWIHDLIEALEKGATYCLVNTSVEGAMLLKEIFGDDMIGNYLELSEEDWHTLLYEKFKGKSYEKTAVASRLAYGSSELEKLAAAKEKFLKFKEHPHAKIPDDQKSQYWIDMIYNYSDRHQSKDPREIALDMLYQAERPKKRKHDNVVV